MVLIVIVFVPSPVIVPLVGLLRRIENASAFSATASSRIATVKVLLTSFVANTSSPLVAV